MASNVLKMNFCRNNERKRKRDVILALIACFVAKFFCSLPIPENLPPLRDEVELTIGRRFDSTSWTTSR